MRNTWVMKTKIDGNQFEKWEDYFLDINGDIPYATLFQIDFVPSKDQQELAIQTLENLDFSTTDTFELQIPITYDHLLRFVTHQIRELEKINEVFTLTPPPSKINF